jgi:hypothetical protein
MSEFIVVGCISWIVIQFFRFFEGINSRLTRLERQRP